MPNEPADPAPTPKQRRPAGPLLLLAASWLLVAVYYVGLVPSMATFAFDYTRNIPITEALPGAFSRSPAELFRDPYTSAGVWFIPPALAVALVYAWVRHTGWKLALATVALLLPVLGVTTYPSKYVILPLLSPAVVGAFLGMCDGETWSEGIVAKGALGAWMLLWAAVLLATFIRLYRRRRNRVGFAVLVGPGVATPSTHTTSSASPTPSPPPASPAGPRTSA